MSNEVTTQLSVETVGRLVLARLRGEPNEHLLRECHERVRTLVEAGRGNGICGVLYDAMGMTPPPVDVPWSQRALDEELGDFGVRRAIVVPNAKLAYLARLAFGDGDYRVFYDDMAAATGWLIAGSHP